MTYIDPVVCELCDKKKRPYCSEVINEYEALMIEMNELDSELEREELSSRMATLERILKRRGMFL